MSAACLPLLPPPPPPLLPLNSWDSGAAVDVAAKVSNVKEPIYQQLTTAGIAAFPGVAALVQQVLRVGGCCCRIVQGGGVGKPSAAECTPQGRVDPSRPPASAPAAHIALLQRCRMDDRTGSARLPRRRIRWAWPSEWLPRAAPKRLRTTWAAAAWRPCSRILTWWAGEAGRRAPAGWFVSPGVLFAGGARRLGISGAAAGVTWPRRRRSSGPRVGRCDAGAAAGRPGWEQEEAPAEHHPRETCQCLSLPDRLSYPALLCHCRSSAPSTWHAARRAAAHSAAAWGSSSGERRSCRGRQRGTAQPESRCQDSSEGFQP